MTVKLSSIFILIFCAQYLLSCKSGVIKTAPVGINKPGCDQPGKFLYYHTGDGANLEIFFDLVNRVYRHQNRSGVDSNCFLNEERDYIAQGAISFVDEDGLTGIESPYSIVVPVSFDLAKTWSVGSVVCESSAPFQRSEVLSIECYRDKSTGRTQFIYDSRVGVKSFTLISNKWSYKATFNLEGPVGILSGTQGDSQ